MLFVHATPPHIPGSTIMQLRLHRDTPNDWYTERPSGPLAK
ncbi:MAG TPA: hypothetical protein VJ717_15395 [Gemmatimonadaceae bacterium]|nr:hypothetical protein [Gemmatimonadaceae bacterium]